MLLLSCHDGPVQEEGGRRKEVILLRTRTFGQGKHVGPPCRGRGMEGYGSGLVYFEWEFKDTLHSLFFWGLDFTDFIYRFNKLVLDPSIFGFPK